MHSNFKDPSSVEFTLIAHPSALGALDAAITKSVRVAVDTETHNAITLDDGTWASLRVVSVAVKYEDGTYEAFVVDVRDVSTAALAPVLSKITVADAWNANFDERILRLAGCPVALWRDAMLTDGILHAGSPGFNFWHPLSWASVRYLGVEMTGKGSTQISFNANSDLTEEQVAYAASDAVITIWVAEELDRLTSQAGLSVAVDNEQAARPFILAMMENGFYFAADEWNDEVVEFHKESLANSLRLMAELSGGSELTLFGSSDKPTWDPNSDVAIRKALNTYAEAAVRAYNGGELLGETDRVNKVALQQIDNPLARVILEYRNHSKITTTYGENLNKYIASDGRIHARYFQGGVVSTGRLSSEEPSAQNLAPQMKTYIRPAGPGQGAATKKVFVHADLSQAEVRVLAQLADEKNLIELFKLGGDFHTLNAGKMFQTDMDQLKLKSPETFIKYRSTTKSTSFGIPYGLAPSTLATTLTVDMGIPTTSQEARGHIQTYLKTNMSVDGYLKERDAFIRRLSENPPDVDWVSTFELYDLRQRADTQVREFRNRTHRKPSMRELSIALMDDYQIRDLLAKKDGVEADAGAVEAERQRQVDELIWAYNFTAPVVLLPDGNPLAWESRTASNRRRIFQVPVDRVSDGEKGKLEGILTNFALTVALTEKAAGADMRDRFATMYNIKLPSGINRCPQRPGEDAAAYRSRSYSFRSTEKAEVLKAFGGANKWLRRELLNFLITEMGREAVEKFLLRPALSACISSMTNQYRNHPIQGMVADIMFEAMGDIISDLKKFEGAFPVQQVHDSVAIECYPADAEAISQMVNRRLEDAMSKWCPKVVAKADTDIRTTLSDSDALTIEQLNSMF